LIDAAALKSDVEQIALPEGRRVGTPGHERARAWLVERLKGMGLAGYGGDSFEHPYEADGQRFTNIIARLPGSDPSLAPVLVAAHYDTAGSWPGADDNAAAMAIALSIVEPLRERRLERDVLLAFFDAEEPPNFLTSTMGSVHFYHRQRTGPIHCAVAMDLVGHDVPLPGLEDLLFITGMESDPGLGEIIQATPPRQGLRVVPALNAYIGDLSDHHAFRLDRRPYLFLSCGHWLHYHQSSDTPEKLNYGKMAAISEFLVDAVEDIAAKPLDGPFEGYDTTPIELEFMRRSIGPLAAALGLKLESRADIDRLAVLLVTQFGL
jgi:hypothetical protein